MDMNFAVFIYLFFAKVSLAYSNTAPSTDKELISPGISACSCGNKQYCNQPQMIPASALPPACTSFFFYGFLIDGNMAIQDQYCTNGKEYINELAKVQPTFAFITFSNCADWNKVLNPEVNLKFHLNNIKTFFKDIKLAGLILDNVFKEGCANLDYISQNLEKYVTYMKAGLTNMSFGLKVEATEFMKYNNSMDFNLLSKAFEFIVISFHEFNECNKETYKTGIVPIFKREKLNSLESFSLYITYDLLKALKVMLMFDVNTPIENCSTAFEKKCVGENTDQLCTGNSTTLYDEGYFVRYYQLTIVVGNVDLDVKDKCECGFSFPGTTFLLNGFNSRNFMECSKFDGPPPA